MLFYRNKIEIEMEFDVAGAFTPAKMFDKKSEPNLQMHIIIEIFFQKKIN